jgi:phage regulator Rha-like protein
MHDNVVTLADRARFRGWRINSREVARIFRKRHRTVLRDIDQILSESLKIGMSLNIEDWFRPVETTIAEDRSFDLSRDGLLLLIGPWKSRKSTEFLIAYIDAFDALDAACRTRKPAAVSTAHMAVREMEVWPRLSPLSART